MTSQTALRLATALAVASFLGGALVSAQGLMLPSSPKKASGHSPTSPT